MTDNIITEYLKGILSILTNDEQKKFYAWVLQTGKVFTKKSKVKQYRKKKQCFYNSQIICLDDNFDYYEGWAVSSLGIPFEHGFNVKRNRVIDTTWEDGYLYFGVYIPKDFIREQWLKTKVAGNLLGKWYLKQKEALCLNP